MTQANLLELARNGNPQAIAALMNLVLEPKGVVAKTQLEGNCLHVVFTSEHVLSQSAIVSFVKNGLHSLGPQSFQTVKLYARKPGQQVSLWVESFRAGQVEVATPVAAPPPTPVATKTTTALPNLQSPVPQTAPAPQTSRPTAHQRATKTAKPPSRSLGWRIKQAVQNFQGPQLGWPRLTRPYQVVIAVSMGAFLVGGAVALMTNTQAKSSIQSAVPSSTGSTTSPSAQSIVPPNSQQPATTPETQVEAYLAQMNKAQQAFYQANGRFAATLEELERSAAILSHSTHYTYRLVLREDIQSVLTATPKQEGLSSYSGTVLPVDATQPTTMATIICKTNQPSSYPPILAQATGQPILCPADASPITH